MSGYSKGDEYHSKSDKHEKGCKCGCLKGLKERLKDNKGAFVGIYEKNGHAVFGKLEKVDDTVVKITNYYGFIPLKFWASGECAMVQEAYAYFISLCAVTEFALYPDRPYPNFVCNGGGGTPGVAGGGSNTASTWPKKPADD